MHGGEEGTRLEIRRGPTAYAGREAELHLGGWCKRAAIDTIEAIIEANDKARPPEGSGAATGSAFTATKTK